MKEYIFPEKVVAAKCAVDTKNLLKKQPLQIGLAEAHTTKFVDGDYVILDFGKEMCGSARILTFAGSNVKIRLRFGESLTECCSEVGGEKNATNDHALRDFTTYLQNYSDMTFANTGFRFLRVDFYGEVLIKSILAVNNIFKKKPIYQYNGKDEAIKRIFETAKRTVDLCASGEYIWDGVKRDRLVWIGDMHPETMALTTLYGRVASIEKSLDFVKEQTPLPGWMNAFPMYSMWWIIILEDYYKKTSTVSFIKKQLSYLQGLVAQMDACVKESGDLEYPLYFVDWPTHEKPDEIHGCRAINIWAARSAIAILKEFGKDTAVAENLLRKLLKIKIAPESSKQVLGLKYFTVGLTEEDKQKLVKGNAQGMSTFMSYYILKAVASFDKKKAIEMMKEFYGAMLDKGATTFWEDFDMAWVENSCRIDEFPKEGQKDIHGDFGAYCYIGFRHSLCHGWAAGVIQFIKEEC
ncbi:MAG: alpha-L-rhamnosidase [Clostridiales bacterium]|nr:alpha-L-rhamnosidase [Clostridiales bacterium]